MCNDLARQSPGFMQQNNCSLNGYPGEMIQINGNLGINIE